MEVPLLDYGGSVNKKVEYSINEDKSGIYLKGFVVSARDLYVVNPDLKIEGIAIGDIEFKVLDIIQYKPWNYGKVNKGAGQMGIYKLKDQKDNIYFAIIKDYRASEGDWRIMLVNIENSELGLKDWLMVDKLGIIFMEYIGMG